MGRMSRPYACEETFETVARYIALYKKFVDSNQHVAMPWNPSIRIHTSNPVGAKNMKAILEGAGLAPTVELARGANRLETIL